MNATSLPTPSKPRWQPLRSGFLNVFRFQQEEFWYEDGHLLLRGNNGSGKSRILALQLPFLLDGDASAHRLEPDGDAAKKIEWNMLMDKYPDRRGYTWLEFGRLDEDSRPCFLTIGCGLYAVEGRPHNKWFFVTRQRVGEGLFLQSPQKEVIGKDALSEAIGGEGQVFTRAVEYRRELDRRLFQLGEHRYAALINLLIQLRQPQLSRDLDEKRLSRALGEALPPPDPQVLADVAEAFRELESDRLQLESLSAARAATDAFHQVYVRYAQVALRRRAGQVRRTHARYEATQRSLKATEERRAQAQAAMDEASRTRQALETEKLALAAEIEALKESPEMRSAAELDSARRAAGDARVRAGEALKRLQSADEALMRRDAEHSAAEGAARAARDHVERQAAETRGAAPVRSLGTALERAMAGASPREELAWATDEARGAQRHLAKLSRTLEEAERAAQAARMRLDAARTEADEAAEDLTAARENLERAVSAYRAAAQGWAAGLVELRPLDDAGLASAVEAWAEALEGPDPVTLSARAAWERSAGSLAAERAETEARRAQVAAAQADLRAELLALESGAHHPPALWATRDAAARQGRSGAPFWQLVDFRPEMSPADCAGLEAALEASGLLDAWVMPDGRVDALEAEAFLAVGAEGLAPEGRSLERWLRPDAAASGGVKPAVVEALLRRIGGEEEAGDAWVAPTGAFQLGPLRGGWRKTEPAHIGASAREAARQRRLSELAEAIAEHDEQLTALEEVLAALNARAAAAQAELDAAPDPAGVIQAATRRDGAQSQLARRESALTAAEAEATRERQGAEAARRARDEGARDLGLTDWVDDLPGLDRAIQAFEFAYKRWLDALGQLELAEREAGSSAARRVEAAAMAAASREEADASEARRVEAAARFETLEALVGTSVQEVMARLTRAQARSGQLGDEVKAAEHRQTVAIEQHGMAKGQAQQLAEELEQDAARRDDAIASLARLAGRELWEVALDERAEPTEAWSASRAVEHARAVETRLSAVGADDDAWQRTQQRMHQAFTQLGEALTRQDLVAEGEPLDDLFLVAVAYRERRLPVHALRGELVQEVTARQTILSAREKEVLENHLVGEVAEHLHERLHEAERLVDEMNREILRCETSTGMTLRFRWAPVEDDAPGLKEALDKLRRRKLTWSSADRALLGAFLQERIQTERARGEGAWHEQLAAALDYRAWHQFSIERKQDGEWKRLTRRTHGTGSGGEKAIALTIPQFAAAAAHYRSAIPAAPRLILLDEAFVGVDKAMRSKCMGLIQAFDLDFVMTSESEWACYATLPGVAIYQLAVRAGVDAVYATRWVWNGRERAIASTSLPPSAPPPERAGEADGNGQLTLGL